MTNYSPSGVDIYDLKSDKLSLISKRRKLLSSMSTISVDGKVDMATGQKAIAGGQKVGAAFMESVWSSYMNLVYHPIALIVFAILWILVASELNGQTGPLEELQLKFQNVVDDSKEPFFLRKLATMIVWFLSLLITYKVKSVLLGFMWIPSIVKPSKRNYITSAIFTLFVIAMKYNTVELLVIGQLWYLFVMLRSPSHKMAILALGIGVFFLGIIDVNHTINKVTKSTSSSSAPGVKPSTSK